MGILFFIRALSVIRGESSNLYGLATTRGAVLLVSIWALTF